MNWEKIAHLLRIAEKAHQWPQLHGLRNAALAELQKHVEEATPSQAPEPAAPTALEPNPVQPVVRRRLSDDTPANHDQSGD